jgi:dipeptidyl aminopeptidase/acylaminoacyl peptidase
VLGRSSPPLIFAALSGLLTSPAAFAASVAVKDGNIVLVQDGRERQLTKSGKDAGPALSPDGKWVAFTRVGNPASTGAQGDCKSGAQADELRRIQVDGSGDELLVRGHDGKEPKQSICDFSSKQFTSDGRFIYFLSPAWATSAALHRYDTRTKALTFVIDANDVIVLNDCKKAENRDNLVVNQHRYFVVAGSYDWYWLFDGTGKKEKGPIGEYDGTQAVRDAINASGLCEP